MADTSEAERQARIDRMIEEQFIIAEANRAKAAREQMLFGEGDK